MPKAKCSIFRTYPIALLIVQVATDSKFNLYILGIGKKKLFFMVILSETIFLSNISDPFLRREEFFATTNAARLPSGKF